MNRGWKKFVITEDYLEGEEDDIRRLTLRVAEVG